MPNKTPQTHTLSIFQAISTRARAKAKARQEQEQGQGQGRKQGKGHKEEQSYSFFLSLLNYLQIHQRVFVAPLIHINITPTAQEFRGHSA